ncbi:glutamyl-tRNA reductase [bacterium]|nr:MAG: glutamyl-tRNA reductase [bacterium]
MSLSPSADRAIGCHATLHLLPSVTAGQCRIGAAGVTGQAVSLVGLSYRSADVSIRSRVSLSGERLERFLGLLREHGIDEAVVLSTCNRTEVYSFGGETGHVVRLLAQFAGLEEGELRPLLYVKSGACAACHLFRVVSGLDSAVLGETEIVAQVKSAWSEASFTGPTLDLMFQRALAASKRVRTETELCRNVTSLGSLAVREAQAQGGSLRDRKVLVLGAGQIAERVAKELRSVGATDVTVLNRTVDRAEALAGRFGFAAGSLTNLTTELATADVVFATATAPEPLITQENAPVGRNTVFIDLGIPANVDLPGTRTLDVDDLAARCARNAEARNAAIPSAMGILESELERFLVTLTERQAAPTIRGLVQHGEAVRKQTVDWAMDRLPNLTDRERQVVEDLARRLVLGMLAPPIEELKKGGFSPNERAIVERAFRLSSEDEGR